MGELDCRYNGAWNLDSNEIKINRSFVFAPSRDMTLPEITKNKSNINNNMIR